MPFETPWILGPQRPWRHPHQYVIAADKPDDADDAAAAPRWSTASVFDRVGLVVTIAGWVLCTSLAIAGRQGSLAARARVARASGVRTLSSRSLEIIYLEAFGPDLREVKSR